MGTPPPMIQPPDVGCMCVGKESASSSISPTSSSIMSSNVMRPNTLFSFDDDDGDVELFAHHEFEHLRNRHVSGDPFDRARDAFDRRRRRMHFERGHQIFKRDIAFDRLRIVFHRADGKARVQIQMRPHERFRSGPIGMESSRFPSRAA